MKHLAQISVEFIKEARDWDEMSLEEQKDYLKRHPASKRKVTARPDTGNKVEEVSGKIDKMRGKLSKQDAVKNANELRSKLSEDEVKAIQDYARFDYDSINKFLRMDQDKIRREDEQTGLSSYNYQRDHVRNIDSAFSKAEPLSDDVVVQRKMTSASHLPSVGDVFVEPGYTSTYFEDTTLKIDSGKLKYDLTIRIPKGTKAIPVMGQLAPYIYPRVPNWSEKFPGEDEPRTTENELLLPRNSKFRVVSKKGTNIQLELISD